MDIREIQEKFEDLLLANPDFDESLLEKDEEGSYSDSDIQHMYSMFEAGTEVREQWQAAKAQAVPEWISVEDSLPKKNANVLLNVVARRRGKPFSCIGFYSVEPDDEPCFILDDNFTILKGVTHWMPLPDAPQEPAND